MSLIFINGPQMCGVAQGAEKSNLVHQGWGFELRVEGPKGHAQRWFSWIRIDMSGVFEKFP